MALLVAAGRGLTAVLWALACTHNTFAGCEGTLAHTNHIRARHRLS